jgi:ABC-type sulfate/molybdate transport systems ATPase subunit
VAVLTAQFSLPLRHFELELALEFDDVVALAGPSGAGKSSTLAVIAGLARPRRGRVTLDGDVWFDAQARIDRPPDRRRVGMVFQEYALFPHMTVRENVAYGGRERVEEFLARLRIDHLATARPDALSGGERQRVALARALARDPGVLLLDEPLAALDPHTRGAVRSELAALLAELGLPTLIVTHDYGDAVALASRVGVIAFGRLRQLDRASELTAHPADAFVAAFTGANLLRGRVTGTAGALTEVTLESGERLHSTDAASGEVDVAVAPWEISLDGSPPANANTVSGRIGTLTQVGGTIRATVGPLVVELALAHGAALVAGDAVTACFDPAATRLLARSSPKSP